MLTARRDVCNHEPDVKRGVTSRLLKTWDVNYKNFLMFVHVHVFARVTFSQTSLILGRRARSRQSCWSRRCRFGYGLKLSCLFVNLALIELAMLRLIANIQTVCHNNADYDNKTMLLPGATSLSHDIISSCISNAFSVTRIWGEIQTFSWVVLGQKGDSINL